MTNATDNPVSRHWKRVTVTLSIDEVDLEVSALVKPGVGTPLVFLHGFGSTKEDYADVAWHPDLGDRPALAYDAPGCGATTCSDLSAISIPFLVRVAEAMLAHVGYRRYHLIGHSMGGLTALLLAHQHPEQVAGFVDIEGNVAPEDCFLSRQIVSHPHDDPDKFLSDFIDRLTSSSYYSAHLYAVGLPHKVHAGAVEPIFTSMVDISDNQPLMEWFLSLPAPRMLMYGDQNNTLSYLPTLRAHNIQLAEIGECGHFPMYANAPQMWRRIHGFVQRTTIAP
jgi:pimeloyl-ACP methyl ester carboxylesterase